MRKQYFADKQIKTNLRITVYSHLLLAGACVFLFLRTLLRGAEESYNYGAMILFVGMALYLLWVAFRTARLLNGLKQSRLWIREDVLDGVALCSVQGNVQEFCIPLNEVQSLAATTVGLSPNRRYAALVLNTVRGQLTLFGLEDQAEIAKYIQNSIDAGTEE